MKEILPKWKHLFCSSKTRKDFWQVVIENPQLSVEIHNWLSCERCPCEVLGSKFGWMRQKVIFPVFTKTLSRSLLSFGSIVFEAMSSDFPLLVTAIWLKPGWL